MGNVDDDDDDDDRVIEGDRGGLEFLREISWRDFKSGAGREKERFQSCERVRYSLNGVRCHHLSEP